LLNHKPSNLWCHACMMGKMRDIKKFKGAFASSRHPAYFLQLVTCDHIVSLSMKALTGATNAFVLKDLMSGLKVFIPMNSKSLAETEIALQFFQGIHKIVVMYSDNAGEIIRACANLGILHESARPGVPQSNAVIERTNLDILEGTRTAMIHAGFPECFWSWAAPHYCFNDNTDHLDDDGAPLEHGSPWFRAKGSESKALRLPFGCAVLFYPSSTKLGDVPAKWEGTAIAGVFAGYSMKRGYDWNGEYLCWSQGVFSQCAYAAQNQTCCLAAWCHYLSFERVLGRGEPHPRRKTCLLD
jgi:hypothetical protein